MCPVRSLITSPLTTSHSLTVLSRLPDATNDPSAEIATDSTLLVCPVRSLIGRHEQPVGGDRDGADVARMPRAVLAGRLAARRVPESDGVVKNAGGRHERPVGGDRDASDDVRMPREGLQASPGLPVPQLHLCPDPGYPEFGEFAIDPGAIDLVP